MLVFGKSGAVRLWSSSGRCLDSRSSCVFGEGMQVSLVLLMLVIFDGFLIFQFTDSCFGSFWLFLVPRDSRGASGFYFGNGNRVAELHQSWLSGIYMLLWIVTEILSVLVFLITLHWPFQVLRPLCVCVCVCLYKIRSRMLFQLLVVQQLMLEYALFVSRTSGICVIPLPFFRLFCVAQI